MGDLRLVKFLEDIIIDKEDCHEFGDASLKLRQTQVVKVIALVLPPLYGFLWKWSTPNLGYEDLCH